MWLFKRNKSRQKAREAGSTCTHCRSTRTRAIAHDLNEQPDYVRTWRGQRFVTCRCQDCGADFYVQEPCGGAGLTISDSETIIEDQAELQAAENELKRQIEDEQDRRCK